MSILLNKAKIIYYLGFQRLLAAALFFVVWSLPVLANSETGGNSQWNADNDHSSVRENFDYFKFVCKPQAKNVTLGILRYPKIFTGTLKEGWYIELHSWMNPQSYNPWHGARSADIVLGQLFDPDGNKFGNQLYRIIPKEWLCTLYMGPGHIIEKIYPRSGKYASNEEFTLKEEEGHDKKHNFLFKPDVDDNFLVLCTHPKVRDLRVYEQPSEDRVLKKSYYNDQSGPRIAHKYSTTLYGLVTKGGTQYSIAHVPMLDYTRLPLRIHPEWIANMSRFILHDKENDIVQIAPVVYVRSSGLRCSVKQGIAESWREDYWLRARRIEAAHKPTNPDDRLSAYRELKEKIAISFIRNKDYLALQESFESFQVTYEDHVVHIWPHEEWR